MNSVATAGVARVASAHADITSGLPFAPAQMSGRNISHAGVLEQITRGVRTEREREREREGGREGGRGCGGGGGGGDGRADRNKDRVICFLRLDALSGYLSVEQPTERMSERERK